MIVECKEAEEAMIQGSFWSVGDNWTVIEDRAVDDSVYKTDGSLLCHVVRGAIPESLCKLAVDKYLEVGKTVSTNRGYAAGGGREMHNRYEKGAAANSGIIGYLDSNNHKRPCRLTEFSKQHEKQYAEGLPFIECINDCYRRYAPREYEVQLVEAEKSPDFIIRNTCFSTVTVNYNFQTALHKDHGDFRNGIGNLSVISEGISGGYILFPKFHVAVMLYTGDYIAMDVHEWHCNSQIQQTVKDGFRLSFVCYLREKMSKCDEVNRRLQGITGQLSTAEWDTRLVFEGIFGGRVPDKKSTGDKWWQMEDDNYVLTYKNKRYKLYDKTERLTVRNLLPAWDYVKSKTH
jgi:hypothetical protein